MTYLEKAIQIDPTRAKAHGRLGATYYVQRNFEAAIPALQKGIDLGLDSIEFYYELGLSYAYLDRCEEAKPWLERALQVDPQAQPALDGLAHCEEVAKSLTPTPAPTKIKKKANP